MKVALVLCVFLIIGGGVANAQMNQNMGSHGFKNNQNSMQQNNMPGMPRMDQYGRPYVYVPQDNSRGSLLGPIRENVYGSGVGPDATGRPVKRAPWPQR